MRCVCVCVRGCVYVVCARMRASVNSCVCICVHDALVYESDFVAYGHKDVLA
jgi:hypothetical protein